MTTATETKPLKMLRLDVENFLRVEALQIDAEGRHVLITGPNGSGKTSAVLGIFAGLEGASIKTTPEPLHRGADHAALTLHLGPGPDEIEYIVQRTYTESRGWQLAITSPGRKGQWPSPQRLLDGLLSTYSLDPIKFLDQRSQDQLEDVLQVCGVAPPVERVEAITGERHDPLKGESAYKYLERLAGDHVGVYYDRRRQAGQTLDRKRGALDEQRKLLQDLGGPLCPEESARSVSDVLGQLQQLEQKADNRRAVQAEAGKACNEHVGCQERLDKLEAESAAAKSAIESLEWQRKDIEEKLRQTVLKQDQLRDRIARGREVVAEAKAEAAAASEAADLLPDPAPEINRLRQLVKTVESGNATIQKRVLAEEQAVRFESDVRTAEGEHKDQETILEGLRNLRGRLLDDIDLGIDGLTVGQGELRLNDLPFAQCSMAEKLRTACAVAMRQQPRLRLLRVDECERLDRQSRDLLLGLADQNGWQCVMTAVADQSELRVEVIDKEV